MTENRCRIWVLRGCPHTGTECARRICTTIGRAWRTRKWNRNPKTAKKKLRGSRKPLCTRKFPLQLPPTYTFILLPKTLFQSWNCSSDFPQKKVLETCLERQISHQRFAVCDLTSILKILDWTPSKSRNCMNIENNDYSRTQMPFLEKRTVLMPTI